MPRPIVPPVALAAHYELIGHFHGVLPAATWRSSIVIKDSSGVPTDITNPIPAVCAFWRANLRTDCVLDHIELRNWSRGVQPFSLAGSIFTSNANCGAGTKTAGGNYGAQGANAVGNEVAAFIRVQTAPGKEGKMFLRQLLDEGDIAAIPGSPWQFLIPGPPNVTDVKFQGILAATIGGFFLSDPGLRVVHFPVKRYLANPVNPANQPFSTSLFGMHIVGPTVNKQTRKSAR